MKKGVFSLLLILLITVTVIFADTNYYWNEPSDEESVGVDVYEDVEEEDPGSNPPIPEGKWVLFAVSGNLKIRSGPIIEGRGGYFGSNCSPDNKNDFSSFGWSGSITPVENFYIGHNQVSQEVINIFSNPNIQSDFYDYWDNDKFGKLPQPVSFVDPSIDFPLKAEHFNPGIELEYKEHPEDDCNGNGNNNGNGNGNGNNNTSSITISNNIHYGELNTTNYSDQKVILEVGTDDLVVQIDNLTVVRDTKFEIQSSEGVANAGRVFLFVGNCNELNNTVIGNPSFQDKTFFFYSGSNELIISGAAKIYGNVYVKDSKVSSIGSGGVKNIISISEKDIVFSASEQLELNSIYAKYSDVTISNTGRIRDGVVTGGSTVDISNVNALAYVYAPKAAITFSNSGNYTGSFIGNSIDISGWSLNIQGPPIDEIEKPVIPRPNPPSGSGGEADGDWLITLYLNPGGVSTGEFAVTTQNGFDDFNDDDDGDGIGDHANDDFEIIFDNAPLGDFWVAALWGNSSWMWTIDDLKDAGLYLGPGQGNPQLKTLHIIPGDYTGNITIYNWSSEKTRVKVDGINGKYSNINNGAPINPGHGVDTIVID